MERLKRAAATKNFSWLKSVLEMLAKRKSTETSCLTTEADIELKCEAGNQYPRQEARWINPSKFLV